LSSPLLLNKPQPYPQHLSYKTQVVKTYGKTWHTWQVLISGSYSQSTCAPIELKKMSAACDFSLPSSNFLKPGGFKLFILHNACMLWLRNSENSDGKQRKVSYKKSHTILGSFSGGPWGCITSW